MTRKYGKKLPLTPRQNFAGGGPIYDYFGNMTGSGGAHINRAGGLTEGPSEEEYERMKRLRIATPIRCWSEDSTFNRPTKGYVPGRLLSGGLAEGGLVEKGLDGFARSGEVKKGKK
jgi:hypothetical protein